MLHYCIHVGCLSLLLAVVFVAGRRGAHQCKHDDTDMRRRLYFSGMVLSAPQHDGGGSDRKGSSFQVLDVGSIRIGVSTEDVFNASRVCTAVGQTIPDFEGGLITCTEEADILTPAKWDLLVNRVLPLAISMHGARLHVHRVATNLSVSYPCTYFTTPAAHIAYGVPNVDLMMYVGAAKIASNDTIAWAGPCQLNGNGRPTLGQANFAPRHLLGTSEAEVDEIVRVGVHELAHAMGFTSYFFEELFPLSGVSFFSRTVRQKPATVVNYTAPVAAAREHFGCESLEWVELEDEGGSGTQLSHWERRNHYQDLMSGVSGDSLYSKLTMSMFEASGNYFPNYALAEAIAYGNRSGCAFLTEQCSANSTTPSIREHFCNDTSTAEDHEMCTFNGKAVGICYTGNVSSLPSYFQYFNDDALRGGLVKLVDHCPMVAGYSNRRCDDSNSSEADSIYGTYYGVGGRCVETQLLALDGWLSKSVVSCLRLRCLHNGEQVQVRVGETEWLSCPRNGSAAVISAPTGYHGSVVCPSASTMCRDVSLHYVVGSMSKSLDVSSSTTLSLTPRRPPSASGQRTAHHVSVTVSPAPFGTPSASHSSTWLKNRHSSSASGSQTHHLRRESRSLSPTRTLKESATAALWNAGGSITETASTSHTVHVPMKVTNTVFPSLSLTGTKQLPHPPPTASQTDPQHAQDAASPTVSLSDLVGTPSIASTAPTQRPTRYDTHTASQVVAVETTRSGASGAHTPTAWRTHSDTQTASQQVGNASLPSDKRALVVAFYVAGDDPNATAETPPRVHPSALSLKSHNFTLTLPQGLKWQGMPAVEDPATAQRWYMALDASGAPDVVHFRCTTVLPEPKGFVAVVNATSVRCAVDRVDGATMRCVLPPVHSIYVDVDETVLVRVSSQHVAQASNSQTVVGEEAFAGAFVVVGEAVGLAAAGRVMTTLAMVVSAASLVATAAPPMGLQSLAILRESPCMSSTLQDDLLWLRYALSPLAGLGQTASVIWNVLWSLAAVVAWAALFMGPGLNTDATTLTKTVAPLLHAVVVLFHAGVTVYAVQILDDATSPSGVGALGCAYATLLVVGLSSLMWLIQRGVPYVPYGAAVLANEPTVLVQGCAPSGYWNGAKTSLRHMFLGVLLQAGRGRPGLLLPVLPLFTNAAIGVVMGLTPDDGDACARHMYGAAAALYLMCIMVALGRPCRSMIGNASLCVTVGSVASVAVLGGFRWQSNGRVVDDSATAMWVLAVLAHIAHCVQHVAMVVVERRWVVATAAATAEAGGNASEAPAALTLHEDDTTIVDLALDGGAMVVGPTDGDELTMLVDLDATTTPPRVPTPIAALQPNCAVDALEIDVVVTDDDDVVQTATSPARPESPRVSPTAAQPPTVLPNELADMFKLLDMENVQL